ncbi:hypothetical protein ACFXTI_014553 [Malus domestica]
MVLGKSSKSGNDHRKIVAFDLPKQEEVMTMLLTCMTTMMRLIVMGIINEVVTEKLETPDKKKAEPSAIGPSSIQAAASSLRPPPRAIALHTAVSRQFPPPGTTNFEVNPNFLKLNHYATAI